MEIYNVKLESSEIVLADEEVAVLNEYKEHRISVTEMCENSRSMACKSCASATPSYVCKWT